MSVPSSVVGIQDQLGLAYWYQDPPTLTGIPLYQEQSKLGDGTFAEVVKVTYQGREWALKRPLTKEGCALIQREAHLLAPLNKEERSANQEHFVQLVAFIVLNGTPMMLLSLYSGGDLFFRIKASERGLSLESTEKITEQMLKAISFLKAQGIFHRDIKLENIFMVGNTDTVRLGDFGLAMRKEDIDKRKEFAGTTDYQSPEFLESYRLNKLEEKPFDFPCDMWATGYVAFYAFSRTPLVQFKKEPQGIEKLQVRQQTAVNSFDRNMDKIVASKGLQTSEALTVFLKTLKAMLALDPTQRLNSESGVALFQERGSPVVINTEGL